jgi:DNA mismatch repair ATPase MutS
MKRIWVRLTVVIGLLAMVVACGSGKYGDANELFKDQAKVTEDYVNGLESANDGDAVAATIDRYTDGMKDLIPRIKAFQEKYPELKDLAENAKVPEELKDATERLNAASAKVQAATMNMMKYMMDPKVQQAMQRMGQELSAMGK